MEEDIVDLIQEIESTQQDPTSNDLVVSQSQWDRLSCAAGKLKERVSLYHYLSNVHVGAYAPTHHYPDTPKPSEPPRLESVRKTWDPPRAMDNPMSFMAGFTTGAAVIVVASIIVTAVIG